MFFYILSKFIKSNYTKLNIFVTKRKNEISYY